MSLRFDTDDAHAVPVRDAATVMLVREAAVARAGFEVCMLRRNLNSDFVGGAYVFPGGGVDDHDSADALEHYCAGLTDSEASKILGIESGGLAFWVAVLRELFEEAGVLLAYDSGGDLMRFDDPVIEARFAKHRRAVDSGERRLVEICEEEGIRLATDVVHYVARWVTPLGSPRRYDTRFFMAPAPEAQSALPDDREVIAHVWITPAEALERHASGDFDLIFPTIRNLAALGEHGSIEELLERAPAREIPVEQPEAVEVEGRLLLRLADGGCYDPRTGVLVVEG